MIDRMRLVALLLGAVLAGCSSGGVGSGQQTDTTTADFSIAYIKRALPTDPAELDDLRDTDDLRQQRDFWTKADVYIRDKASPGGTERNITARITGSDLYDVRDLEVSADGTKLLFAMRGPLAANQQEEDPPSWAIWEYDVAADQLRRVIPDDVTAGAGEDVSPHYLPDGRILFTSTRQRDARAILIDEGKSGFTAVTEDLDDEPAFVMHAMAADGTLGSIHQTSYNQSHDRDLSVLRNGRVLLTRWDNESGNGNRGMALYTARPDGADLQLLYGARSHNTGNAGGGMTSTIQFAKAREMEDGRILALLRPFTGSDFGGNLVLIDTANYVENAQRTLAGVSANVAAAGPAQSAATQNDVRTVPGPSPGGRFNSAYPLWDGSNRVLVSWSQCRLLDTTGAIVPCTDDRLADPNAQVAAPLYSAWLLSLADGTLKPVITPVENAMISDLVSLQPRAVPTFIADTPPALALAPDLAVGILDIRSVYDWDGAPWSGLGGRSIAQIAALPAAQRPARFLRIEKAVSIPDQDTLDFDRGLAFGRAGNFMREILGYVPIEPDGSVRVKVPANVAFNVSVLDANARRIFTPNRVWQQLRPSEIADCNGCYYAPTTTTSGGVTTTLSHGRAGLFNSANAGGTTCPGETMAQQASGWNCGNSPYSAPTPNMNVAFNGAPTGDADIDLRYQDLTTLAPTRQSCLTGWLSGCRSTISYPLHIKQIWSADRGVGGLETCISCHNSSPRDAANVVKSGAAQLDLTDDTAQATPALQSQRSYDQLTLGHGFVIEVLDPNDPMMMATILVASPTDQPAAISAGNANINANTPTRFFSIFAAGGSHAGRLTEAELRLLSEWVDIGTQYYNNPFDAPLN